MRSSARVAFASAADEAMTQVALSLGLGEGDNIIVEDMEFGSAAAVARWTAQGKEVVYRLAFHGLGGVLDGAVEALTPIAERLATCTRIGPDWV